MSLICVLIFLHSFLLGALWCQCFPSNTLLKHCSRKEPIYKCVLLERKITRVPHLFVSWNVSKLPAAENSSWDYTAVLRACWSVCLTLFPQGGMFDLKRSKTPCKDRVWRLFHSPLQFCHGTWWIPSMCCFILFCMVTNLGVTLSAAFRFYKFRDNSWQLKSAGWCRDSLLRASLQQPWRWVFLRLHEGFNVGHIQVIFLLYSRKYLEHFWIYAIFSWYDLLP